jgi:CRP-like cAMP-binding protein
MDAMRALQQVIMFRDLPEPVLRLVAGVAEEHSLAAGETFVSPSSGPNALFVIRSGTVRAVLDAADAPPVLFGTGETIGDLPFVDGEPGPGTLTALERVDLLVLRGERLAAALEHHPEAAALIYRAIARSLAGRLRRAVSMLAFASARAA